MDENNPEFNASFLFLLDIAKAFSKLTFARETNNFQLLLRLLESIALKLTGYYEKADIKEHDIEDAIFHARRELEKIIERYKESQEIEYPESLIRHFYKLERDLTHVWKQSGLQMKFNSDTNEIPDF